MNFKIFGPYDIPDCHGHDDWFDKEDTDALWTKIDAATPGLSDACGVYLFGVRGAVGKRKTIGKTLPWYVGKAEKQAFRKECFTGRNLNEFNRVAFNVYRGLGTPFLYLVTRVEKDGTFSPPTKTEYPGVRFVEELLIHLSLEVNNDLANIQGTRFVQQTRIEGILNPKGKPTKDASGFKGVFGISQSVRIHNADAKHIYGVVGPLGVPVQNQNAKKIAPDDVLQMWDEIRRKRDPYLHDATGVYVVGIKFRMNTTPWYIGTASQHTFMEKCLRHDLDQINDIVAEKPGSPVVYFLPRLKREQQGFARVSSGKQVRDAVEYVRGVLLRYGSQVNKGIFSEDPSDKEMLEDLQVEGLINSDGRRLKKELKELLGR